MIYASRTKPQLDYHREVVRLRSPSSFALAALAVTAACGGSDRDSGTPIDASPDAGGGGELDHQRFIGRLTATPTVAFGGSPFCNYTVTLREVVIDLTVRASTELTALTLSNNVVEATVGSCPFAPSPLSKQVFDHRGGPRSLPIESTVEPMLEGVSANQPKAIASGLVQAVSSGAYIATLRWERTDQPDPLLKWVVATARPVALARTSCEVNDLYCLGGTTGSLYRCTDGSRLRLVNPCVNGCALALPPSTAPHADEACR